MENYSEILVERLQKEIEQAQLSKNEKQEGNMFLDELLTIPLDQRRLRELAYKGCPDSIRGIRPTVWKVLLGYLVDFWLKQPANFSKWEHILQQRRDEYDKFLKLCLAAENFPDHQQFTKDHVQLIEDNKLSQASKEYSARGSFLNVLKDIPR